MPGSDAVAAARSAREPSRCRGARRAPAPLAALASAMRGPVCSPAARPTPVSRPPTTAATRTCARRRWPSRSTRATSRRPCASRARATSPCASAPAATATSAPRPSRAASCSTCGACAGIKLLADGSVLAGAGLRQIELIAALARRGRAVVHGSCPTVGVAGFTLGGGYGFDARRYGLACDTLVAAQVVDLRTLSAGRRRRRPAARPARRRREPRARDGAAAEDASRRSGDDVLRRLPVVARGRDRGRVHRALRGGARRRSPSICSVSTGSGSATVEVFGQYLGTGARGRARRSRPCCPPARSSPRTRTPTSTRS